MVRFGQEKNRNSGLRSNDRNYRPRKATSNLGDSRSPFGQGGGSESDSGGGGDLKCYNYWLRMTLGVQYNNQKIEKGSAFEGMGDAAAVTIGVESGRMDMDFLYTCEHAVDSPLKGCVGCEYRLEMDYFRGFICPDDKETESVSEFVRAGQVCAPENNCKEDSSGNPFKSSCTGTYNLTCFKSWLQCGENEEFEAQFPPTKDPAFDGDRGDGLELWSTQPISPGSTGGGEAPPNHGAAAGWAVLKNIAAWKGGPGEAGSDLSECEMCDFLCCLLNKMLNLVGPDGGRAIPSIQDCKMEEENWWWMPTSVGEFGWDGDRACYNAVVAVFTDFLLSDDSKCKRGEDSGGVMDDISPGCPGCCGENSGRFK